MMRKGGKRAKETNKQTGKGNAWVGSMQTQFEFTRFGLSSLRSVHFDQLSLLLFPTLCQLSLSPLPTVQLVVYIPAVFLRQSSKATVLLREAVVGDDGGGGGQEVERAEGSVVLRIRRR